MDLPTLETDLEKLQNELTSKYPEVQEVGLVLTQNKRPSNILIKVTKMTPELNRAIPDSLMGVPVHIVTSAGEQKVSKMKVPNQHRVTSGAMASKDTDGCNGVFRWEDKDRNIRCIVSSGMGWEHVSVSITNETDYEMPTWDDMCMVKDLFWEEDATVVQYHPAKGDYVNVHNYVLHLWRPIDDELPKPPKYLIG